MTAPLHILVNINAGNNDKLVSGCKPLSDYMTLVNRIRENRKAGQPYEQAIDRAVVSCIEDHIMEDFLTDHRSEVLSVCITEFDEEKFIRTIQTEAETKWQNRLKMLTEVLSSKNRINDIVKSASEPEYAKMLMAQYGI